jgi:hypothetical protein
MIDPRPTPEQPKDKPAASPALTPSTTAGPANPIVTGPQPKGPDSGGNPPRVAGPKDPARISTPGKP